MEYKIIVSSEITVKWYTKQEHDTSVCSLCQYGQPCQYTVEPETYSMGSDTYLVGDEIKSTKIEVVGTDIIRLYQDELFADFPAGKVLLVDVPMDTMRGLDNGYGPITITPSEGASKEVRAITTVNGVDHADIVNIASFQETKDALIFNMEIDRDAMSAASWISVKDRLPPEGVETLVSGGDGINISCYGELGSYFDKRAKEMGWGDGQDEQPGTLHVTHWMPLPSPPNKEQ